MPRRILFAVALAAMIMAACGGSSAAPALTDPKDILVHAASSIQTLKTVHLKATLAGKIDSGAVSGKPTGALVDLAGSTLEGDLDAAGEKGLQERPELLQVGEVVAQGMGGDALLVPEVARKITDGRFKSSAHGTPERWRVEGPESTS